jgi:hypothetical protein
LFEKYPVPLPFTKRVKLFIKTERYEQIFISEESVDRMVPVVLCHSGFFSAAADRPDAETD